MPVLSFEEIRRALKEGSCVSSKVAQGGCRCDIIGKGWGLGWKITVTCGNDTVVWNVPASRDGEGVGYPGVVPCDQLAGEFSRTLEWLDNQRALALPVASNSWHWPASFFLNRDGTPINQLAEVENGDWIKNHCNPVPGPPYALQAGDVIVFEGTSWISPTQKIHHSAIATGRGDEVSHMWWTRDIQDDMVNKKVFSPHQDWPGPAMGGYAVTRDSLAAIQSRFDDGAGRHYLTDDYKVFRIKDARFGDFQEFSGCD